MFIAVKATKMETNSFHLFTGIQREIIDSGYTPRTGNFSMLGGISMKMIYLARIMRKEMRVI